MHVTISDVNEKRWENLPLYGSDDSVIVLANAEFFLLKTAFNIFNEGHHGLFL